MKKPYVAIVTITDGCNYGNRLQNYALQKVIEDLGYNVETLENISYLNNIDNYEENYKEYLCIFGKEKQE